MGTSTGYDLPTTGNWPDVKRNATALGRTGTTDSFQTGRLMNGYVQAQGGATAVAHQMATANRTGGKLGGLFSGIRGNGLQRTLEDIGLGNLVGKSASEVMRGLIDYLIVSDSLLDEALVREAFQDYRDEVIGKCDTYEELDTILSRLSIMDSIGENVKRFFGFFVFCKFRRDFKEQLMRVAKNIRTSNKLLKSIKVYIFGRVNNLTLEKDYKEINWRGKEGMQLAEEIQASAWRVFGEQ